MYNNVSQVPTYDELNKIKNTYLILITYDVCYPIHP